MEWLTVPQDCWLRKKSFYILHFLTFGSLINPQIAVGCRRRVQPTAQSVSASAPHSERHAREGGSPDEEIVSFLGRASGADASRPF